MTEFRQRVIGQQRDVSLPFAQWGNRDSHDVHTIVEIFAKAALRDLLGKVLVGSGNQPNINPKLFITTYAANLLFLQDPQNLGLEPLRKIGDFVEEQSRCIGAFK